MRQEVSPSPARCRHAYSWDGARMPRVRCVVCAVSHGCAFISDRAGLSAAAARASKVAAEGECLAHPAALIVGQDPMQSAATLSARWTDVVCAGVQTAKVTTSKLFLDLEAYCTACRLCLAELARDRDRTGIGCRRSQLTLEAMSANNRETEQRKVHSMLYTIAVVLLVLWLLGLVTSYTMGGLLHILLVVAIIMIVFNLISGRRVSS